MCSSKFIKLFAFAVFLEMISGAYPWFFWGINTNYLFVLCTIISLLYVRKNKLKLNILSNYGLGFALLFMGTLLNVNSYSINERVYQICSFIPMLVIVSDKDNGEEIYSTIAKWLSYLLVPSILLHFVFQVIGFPLSTIIINKNVPDSYVFFNYFILLKNIVTPDSIRFCSVFLEPGYLGTMLSFLLYVGRFNFEKKYNIVFLVALILTISLAGFVIAALGWVLIKIQEGKSVKRLIQIVCVFGFIYYFGINYNGGNNIFNNQILSRLQYDKENGISGNNRNSHMTDDYFDYYMQNGDILLGVGKQEVRKINGGGTAGVGFNDQIRGAGYKIFFITNGVVEAIVILFGYLMFVSTMDRKYGYGFLLLIVLTFVQAAYPLSTSWLIPFVFGCVLNSRYYENRYSDISSCS